MEPLPFKSLQDSSGKVPPHAIQVEQYVLGTVLDDPTKESASIITELLTDKCFWIPKHRYIFKAIQELFTANKPTTSIDLIMYLHRDKSQIMSEAEITHLQDKSSSSANLDYYCRVLIQKMILRESIRVMGRTISKAYDPGVEAFDVLSEAEHELFALSNKVIRGSTRSLTSMTPEVITEIMNPKIIDGCTGIPSKFDRLDKLTGGWQNSDLIILAGRPGMGKTSLGMSAMLNANVPCIFFSLEMKNTQLVQRILAMVSQVNLQRMRTGNLNTSDYTKIKAAQERLSQRSEFHIEDTQELTLKEIRSKCLRLRSEKDIKLIMVDYLQLMHDPGKKYESREAEVSRIARGLKGIAKELDIPVIALAQLNRNLEDRRDKRPRLSDLRESGAIEQVADLVLMLYRNEVYSDGRGEDFSADQGKTELILCKHRNGPTGVVDLQFIKETTHFININPYRNPPPDSGTTPSPF